MQVHCTGVKEVRGLGLRGPRRYAVLDLLPKYLRYNLQTFTYIISLNLEIRCSKSTSIGNLNYPDFELRGVVSIQKPRTSRTQIALKKVQICHYVTNNFSKYTQ